jgi:2-oxoglutarate ferredoxin oxidoreductase subunit gamma
MADYNIISAGFGGQGGLFAGNVMANAGLVDGKEVSWLPSYGPEMRGGTANCSVRISDGPIGSPLVTSADIVIALNGPSFEKFVGMVAPGGAIFYDSDLSGGKTDRADIKLFPVRAAQLSTDANLKDLANMIMLGKVLKETGFSSLESVEQAIEKSVSDRRKHLIEPNIRAVKLGMGL